MKVDSNEILRTYLVVMEVKTTEKEDVGIYSSRNVEKDVKYFKKADKQSEVLRIATSLKDNEKISAIFSVDETGVTFPKTIEFDGGKFKLVDIPKEEK